MDQIPFLDRIKAGEILVADGATGTNLQKQGLPRGVSSEAWLFDKPDAIVALHKAFIQAGADIVLTNTFGGSPLRLEAAELKDKVVEVNRTAVSLAKEAINGAAVFVGGSLGPSGRLLKPFGPLTEDEVMDSYKQQARALDEAGVDLMVVETQFDLNEAKIALQAVRSVSSQPLVCSFSFDRGARTMMGVDPKQMALQLGDLGVDMFGVNCGRSLDENLRALEELRKHSEAPLWFKPNAGIPQVDEVGNSTYTLTPVEMGHRVDAWVAAGAQVVGGCCGTSPEHLTAIANAVRSL